jgi:uncharacterized phage protein (TIGR02218 family)
MKSITTRLKTYLDSKPQNIIIADCFTLTLKTGTAYRWTNADVPVVVYRAVDDDSGVLDLGVTGTMVLGDATGLTPNIFLANSIRIQGLKSSQKIGLDVDEQDVTVYCLTPPIFRQSDAAIDSGVLNAGKLGTMVLSGGPYTGPSFGPSQELIEGVPFLWACMQGLLDYATLTRETAFLPAWGSPAIGSVVRFYGEIGPIDKVGYSEVQIKVKSMLGRLDTPFPRNIYQPTCRHVLFDGGCALNKSSFQTNGTVGASSTQAVINWSSGKIDGFFNLGTLTFTSGVLNGVSIGIKASDSATLTLEDLLPVAPNSGDTFHAYQGCDHTSGLDADGNVISGNHGCASFNNLAHFGGFPRVPAPITAA